MKKRFFLGCWWILLKVKTRLRTMPLPELAWLAGNSSVPDEVFVTCDDILFHEYRLTPDDDSTCHCFRKALLRVVPMEELDLLIKNMRH